MRKYIIIGMVALLALAYGPATHVMAQPKVVRITLIDENGSGQDGSAQATDQGNGTTKVEVLMTNQPEGSEQPAGIHEGTCANLDADVAFALQPVKDLKSTSTINTPLSTLLNSKYALAVTKSATDNTVISCGIFPSAAVAAGGTLTLAQVMSTLLDQAEELEGTIKKKETDGSANAWNAFHATFAAHENEIKAKSAPDQAEIDAAMEDVNKALEEGNWDEAATAAEVLVTKVKEAQTALAGASMDEAMEQLQEQTNDLVRETTNKDATGAQAAYDAFHETFAANEDAIKAKSADAQAKIEDKMHEVRDAIQEKNWEEAANAAKELHEAVKAADALVSGGTSSSGGTETVDNTSAPATGLAATMATLASQANDLVRETTNKDTAGAQAAYDDFHNTFAANEDAIKAQNAGAQANIEAAMHEVRDAIQAGDWTKASAAANELVDTVREATDMVSGASGGDSLPTSGGDTFVPVAAGLALLALGLLSLGVTARRRAMR